MPHGVKLMRITTLSCAWAAPAPSSVSASAPRNAFVIVKPPSKWSHLSGRVAAFPFPRNPPLDPRHQAEERGTDRRERDDRREGSRGVEVEAAGEDQIAEPVRGGEPFGDDRAEHRERGGDA